MLYKKLLKPVSYAKILFFTLPLFFLVQSCKVDNLFESARGKYDQQLVEDSLVFGSQAYVLKPDDKINFSVWDHNELSVGSIYSIYDANEVYGRWLFIDEEGYANLPRLGRVKLAGLTVGQAKKMLAQKFGAFLKYPIIEVQVLNKQVTVLGEVLHPGNVKIEKEKTTLLECIGAVGGFDFYADMKHVKLIRHSADTSYHYVLDLTSMDPYVEHNITVKNGDVVYVPAKNAKQTDKRVSVIIPFTAIVSSVVLILSFIQK